MFQKLFLKYCCQMWADFYQVSSTCELQKSTAFTDYLQAPFLLDRVSVRLPHTWDAHPGPSPSCPHTRRVAAWGHQH